MENIKPPRGAQLDKSHPLNRGLVGFWLMNEGDGKKVFDLSGNGNHGTIHNMAFPPTAASGWNAGRRGVGLSFDGTDDHVNCGNDASLDITDAITMEAWVKLNGVNEKGYIVAKGNPYGTTGRINMYWYGTTNALTIIDGETDRNSAAVFTDNGVWVCCAVTIDSSHNITFYRNGIFAGSETMILTSNNDDVNMGNRSAGTSTVTLFNGQIDQVRIYNRALSAEEIKQLYLYPYGK